MYKAKQRYQNTKYAENYDKSRFTSIFGKIAHAIDVRALNKAASKFKTGSQILDIPCGTGRITTHLANKGFKVAGVDISNEMIEVAKKKDYSDNLLSFKAGPAEKIPYSDNSFDHLTSCRFFIHLPSEARIESLREFSRVSKGNIIVGYHLKNIFGDIARTIRTKGSKEFVFYKPSLTEAINEIESANLKIIKTFKVLPIFHDYQYFLLQQLDKS